MKLKRTIVLGLTLSVLMIFASLPMTLSQGIPRPDHIIVATIGEPETVDPAWLYDTASAELAMNVYEPLINFAVNRGLPRAEQGLTGEFVPAIATEWSIEDINETDPDTGLTWVQRYYFKIREGVKFHDPTYGTVTTEDVEYTFERWMVQFRSGGPTWMISEPTLGVYRIRPDSPDPDPVINGKMIDHAVESNATHVWFNLVMPYAPLLAILAQSWAGIISKQWAIDHNDFPGFDVTGYDGWVDYNNPAVSPLDDYPPGTGGTVMMGAGPYKFDYWDKGVEWSLTKFDDYYGGWPAVVGGEVNEGYISRVTEKFVSEWATRKMLFLAGDVDFVYVPRVHLTEMWLNYPDTPEEYPPGIRCDSNLPLLVASPVFFFTYNVTQTSPLLGPGFDKNDPYKMAEDRIPIDFFSDINVRKAFASAFDYGTYIDEVFMGEAVRAATPIVEGLPFHNPAQQGYDYDLSAAETFFQAAYGGTLWTTGFTISLSYNTGNVARRLAGEMLKSAIEGLNTKFHVEVTEVDWPSYLKMLVSGELTGFVLGWLADFPDDHNFAMPFMHTYGDFGGFQQIQYGQSGRKQISYTVNGVPFGDPTKVIDNAYVDEMIENGVKTADPNERRVIYYELQAIYVDESPGFPLCKPSGRHWERDWVQGWYYNPIYPGGYFYHYWKALSPEYTAPEAVDISAVGSITDLAGLKIAVTPNFLKMYPTPTVEVSVHRLDSNPNVAALYVIIALNRTDVETGYSTIIEGSMETIVLTAGASYTAEFVWNETEKAGYEGLPGPAEYQMSGVVGVISGFAFDENPANNLVTDGTVTVLVLVGDLDNDGAVGIKDLYPVAAAFGTNPGDDRWNANADLDGDGRISIKDIYMVASNFGKTLTSLVA